MDRTFVYQMTGLQYSFTSAGKIQVESKNSLLQRGKESPDEADAFVLTHAPFWAKRHYRPLVYDDRGINLGRRR